ncbi:MAG: carboxyl transferase, partial [Deltaproteobacteria bacterium]|nr:carboxyl transferase [Deltaproteobacteria bacterium]
MTWQAEVDEIRYRKKLAEGMGGPVGIEKQRTRGKLTVRERFALLADPGSFQEFNALTGSAVYKENKLDSFTPKASVHGMCKVNGRKVIVSGGDFTVRESQAALMMGLGSEPRPNERAREWRIPYIRLLDAVGGSVKSFADLGRTYLPDGNIWSTVDIELLTMVPVVSAVLGSVAGLPAVEACFAHFNVMVKGISQLFPGGPPVVKAALGQEISKEELGGEQVHAYKSGVVDNLAETEAEALQMIKQFLSYLPDNVWEMPPHIESKDDPERCDEELLSVIPRSRQQPYDPYSVLKGALDLGSFFEISPLYGRGRITGLARVNGYPVGVMINNIKHLGGSTDVAAGNKVIRLLQLCETFHLPLVSFVDEPGFMVGLESELQGIERAGARLVTAVCRSKIPWISFIMRQVYGVGGQCQHRPTGMYRRYAWPSGRWGSMHVAG